MTHHYFRIMNNDVFVSLMYERHVDNKAVERVYMLHNDIGNPDEDKVIEIKLPEFQDLGREYKLLGKPETEPGRSQTATN